LTGNAGNISTGKKTVVYTIFVLLSVIFLGIIFSLTTEYNPEKTDQLSYPTWLVIAYLAGLSMIVLPCTLPFVFIIVPMTIDKGYKKGLAIALLFGGGMTTMITLYGLALAFLGKTTGLSDVSTALMMIAGIISFIFGLNRLKLIDIKLPSYSGTPKFFQGRSEYSKAGLMGLLVGNAGVGCTNPLFYIMLIYIMSTGNPEIGASLGFVHGIGRAIPLILVAVLAIVGFNPTRTLVSKRTQIEKVSGFVMIALGAFLIINGIPEGQQWFMTTFMHTVWNDFVEYTHLPKQLIVGMLPQQSASKEDKDNMEGMNHERMHAATDNEMEMITTKKDFKIHFWWEPKGILEKGATVTFNVVFHDPKTQLLVKDVTYDLEVFQKGNRLETRPDIYTQKGYDKQDFRFSESGDALIKIKNINGKDTEGEFAFEVVEATDHVTHAGAIPRFPLELVPVFLILLITFPIIWYTIKNRKMGVNV
jgi:cytochrome c-type biogenesis protein